MMTNLFSIFDPATSLNYSLNWMVMFLMVLLSFRYYYLIPSYLILSVNYFFTYMYNEFSNFLKCSYSSFFFSVMMYFIFVYNFIGLFPYIFTLTSHLVFTLSFSLALWFTYMLYGWFNFCNSMFSHLVPQGTPPALMVFMVMIETVSNFIRPITLSVRLAANMIAGHLLLCLIGSLGPMLEIYMLIIMLIIQVALFVLELGVSLIQAYVFSVLSSLYSSDVEMGEGYNKLSSFSYI